MMTESQVKELLGDPYKTIEVSASSSNVVLKDNEVAQSVGDSILYIYLCNFGEDLFVYLNNKREVVKVKRLHFAELR
jgi:hypothetical protein